MLALLVALVISVQPHDCQVSLRPMLGPDPDGPAGIGVDGAKVTMKCIF